MIEFKLLFLPKSNMNDNLDFEWINNKIKPFINTNEYINILFIFDDVIVDIYKNRKCDDILKFVFNRRVKIKN